MIGDLFEVPEEEIEGLDIYVSCSNSDPEPYGCERKKISVRDGVDSECEAWVWEYVQPVDEKKWVSNGVTGWLKTKGACVLIE